MVQEQKSAENTHDNEQQGEIYNLEKYINEQISAQNEVNQIEIE